MNFVVYQDTQFEVARNDSLTNLLEGIRDNDSEALGKINNYTSMKAAKQATTIYNNYKNGVTKKRIVPGVDGFEDKDFDCLFFMTHKSFEQLNLDEKACGAFKYKGHTFFREWKYN